MNSIDQNARDRALDVNESFIVQAPAGSGKTTLLTQRYLALLERTQCGPEQIVAITFTRKAAQEMQARILNALDKQADVATPSPHDLRIMTFDSLCWQLCQQAPLVSGITPETTVCEHARPYYEQAAQQLLLSLNGTQPWQSALLTLCQHLDNDQRRIHALLADMLTHRDQWLPHIARGQARESLESALAYQVEHHLQQCRPLFPPALLLELTELLQYVGVLQPEQTFPEATANQLDTWQSIAHQLLTQSGQWRVQVTQALGFSASNQSMKTRMKQLLSELTAYEMLRINLAEINRLPQPYYNDLQWAVLEALITLLPVLTAELMVVFKQHRCIDFVGLQHATHHALGAPDSPSSLTLKWDALVKHILVDEFQDTSWSQFRLLEQLTAGWEAGDGRTLFIVGDPMQSIYRFRQAEVGNFLIAQQHGIGDTMLNPLVLTQNFRANAPLIEWINQTCQSIFPSQDDLSCSAIAYSPSLSTRHSSSPTVHTHWFSKETTPSDTVAERTQRILAQYPNDSLVILVRTRTQLWPLIQSLRARQIAYQATDMERLIDSPAIIDLLALTQALLYPTDRIAWLSILHAPWCGLTLAELTHLFEHDESLSLWDAIQACDEPRLAFFKIIIQNALSERQRTSLSQWVEQVWLDLKGPCHLHSANELKHVDLYFEQLEYYEKTHSFIDIEAFSSNLQRVFINTTSPETSPLHIMTIHRAKGLEFDHVLLAGLHTIAQHDSHSLLQWQEQLHSDHSTQLLLAPIKGVTDDQETIYRYLRCLDKKKQKHEWVRLLYVAMTRARQSLHLFLPEEGTKEGSLGRLLESTTG